MFILRSDITHYYYRVHGTHYTEGNSFNWFPRFAVPSFLWFHAQKTSNTYWIGIAIVYRFPNIIIRLRQMHASRSWNSKRKLKCIFCCYMFFVESLLFLRNGNGYEIFRTEWFTIFSHSPKSILIILFTEWIWFWLKFRTQL